MPTKENSSLPLLISPRLEGENNREYAYRVLRQNIITLQFAPGQTLSEAELSEKLEMSRTPAAAMTVSAFEALGAKPTPMALAEVFTSLQQGTIEAQENPLAMIYTKSLFEVQKYLILTAHLRAWVYVAMGKAQFDALPAELQQVVMDGAAAAQAAEHQLFLDNEEKYYNEIQEKGMEFIEVDTQEFADAMIGGVLPTLTDSQKKLYDKIAALA